jgi:hypothetical protein
VQSRTYRFECTRIRTDRLVPVDSNVQIQTYNKEYVCIKLWFYFRFSCSFVFHRKSSFFFNVSRGNDKADYTPKCHRHQQILKLLTFHNMSIFMHLAVNNRKYVHFATLKSLYVLFHLICYSSFSCLLFPLVAYTAYIVSFTVLFFHSPIWQYLES